MPARDNGGYQFVICPPETMTPSRRRLLSMTSSALASVVALNLLSPPQACANATQAAIPARLLQYFPIAGFCYYLGAGLWNRLLPGVELRLVREAENPYDNRAVAVYWQHEKLGFVPRDDNAAISQLLDRGEVLRAHLHTRTQPTDWRPLEIAVTW
jgi:HIRAN domain